METTIMVPYSKSICFSIGGNRIRTLLLILGDSRTKSYVSFA